MKEAAGLLVGTRDFGCFTLGVARFLAAGRRRTTVRTIFTAEWHGEPPTVDFDVVGTAFLPHMIRNMVGSMLRVGQRKLTPEEFRGLVERSDPWLSTMKVPAHGLMLVGVEY
jgi:tRNA pseudouridine38-40 synthase